MAVTFGFYNSIGGDRKYHAVQMASIFDGIITDGVLFNVGERFFVRAAGGLAITVGSGRAWFDHTWTLNDSILSLTVQSADLLLDRIDALVLEVDRRDGYRMNSIRWVYGTLASIPQRPALINEPYIRQYPLAYISVPRGITDIQQANITNMVGTADIPYVTAPLDKIDISELTAQWSNQWSILLSLMEQQKVRQEDDWRKQTDKQEFDWQRLFNEMRLIYQALETETFAAINNNFDDWSVKRGCEYITEFLPDGDIWETIRVIALDFVMADRLTEFLPDGNISITINWHKWPD